MTAYHTHDRIERGKTTMYRKRWVTERVQDLMLETDISSDDAHKQAERDWIEFTDCPF